MNVAFVNENTLGHSSYLPRFVRELERCPELEVCPHLLDVTPLPAGLQRRADFTIRGLRKLGLDFHVARWRRVVSAHARRLVDTLRHRQSLAAIVVNTQSVALDLVDLATEIPLFVCLDATFEQLRRSEWFAPNRGAKWLLPLTLVPIRKRERRLLAKASCLLPWSKPVRESLLRDYSLPSGRIEILPPSLDLARLQFQTAGRRARPQILFVGGDFIRKGGPLLLEAFRAGLASRADLHVMTQSTVEPEPAVFVHHGVAAQSGAWFERWSEADVFVFPSKLETFGIVLVEAMAFGVPVVSSRVGGAVDLLDGGRNGILLDESMPAQISKAILQILNQPEQAQARSQRGRERVERDFDLRLNTERMAELLKSAVSKVP